MVLGCAIAFAVFGSNLLDAKPLYATRGAVLMVEPPAKDKAATFFGQGSDLSPFAAAIERRANGGRPVLRLNSANATLAGTGVREGVRVVVPNYGGQWAISFPVPELAIEVVSSNPDAIVAQYRDEVSQVQAIAKSLQDESGIPKNERIRTVPRTMDPQVNYVGTTKRGQIRALAAALLLGTCLTVGAAFGWDRIATRISRQKSRRHPQSQP